MESFNQTTKIERVSSMSSQESNHNLKQEKQIRKPQHHKNATLPNAAVLLLNEITQKGEE
jgi:hypothetical protein